MALLANTTVVRDVFEAFPTAQDVRVLLQAHGFIPLARIEDGEHWVRAGRRIILMYTGDHPGDVEPIELLYATIVRCGDSYTLSLD